MRLFKMLLLFIVLFGAALVISCKTSLPTGTTVRTLTIDGQQRSYLIFVPKDLDQTEQAPLLLAFHGGSSSAKQMAKGLDLNERAGQAGFIIAYPEGYRNSWNAGPGNWGPAAAEGIDDVAFVRRLLADLSSQLNIDPHRIYATGISNGSAMAYRLACELSDKIAAVAGVTSSLSLPECNPARPVPIIHFWGTADRIQRSGASSQAEQASQTVATWVRLNGCTDETRVTYKKGAAECITYSNCRDRAEITLCTIKGMGHRWPGVEWPKVFDTVLGPGTSDILATEMIIQFFLAHPMPELTATQR